VRNFYFFINGCENFIPIPCIILVLVSYFWEKKKKKGRRKAPNISPLLSFFLLVVIPVYLSIYLTYHKNLNNWTVCYAAQNPLLWSGGKNTAKTRPLSPPLRDRNKTKNFSTLLRERKVQRHSTPSNYSSFYGILTNAIPYHRLHHTITQPYQIFKTIFRYIKSPLHIPG